MEICLDTKKTTTTSSTNIDTVGIESPRDELGEDNDFEEKKGSSSFFPGFSLLKKEHFKNLQVVWLRYLKNLFVNVLLQKIMQGSTKKSQEPAASRG